MGRDQKVEYYQNLLIICLIPFIMVLVHTLDYSGIELPEPKECLVYHDNAPAGKKCQEE